MCGIVGVYGNRITRDTHRRIFNLYYNQKQRGTDGAGAIIKTDADISRYRSTSPSRLFAYHNFAFWRKAKDGSIILMHHRYPTSTDNKAHCNHPIANEAEDIFIIHNGVMANNKKDLAQQHTFETQDGKKYTDSEVVVHIIEELLADGRTMQQAILALPDKLKGSYALAIVHKAEHRIYLLKNWMPIVISKDAEGNTYFSSIQIDMANYSDIYELKTDEIGFIDSTGYHCLKEGKEYPSFNFADWKQKPITERMPKGKTTYENNYSDAFWQELNEGQHRLRSGMY